MPTDREWDKLSRRNNWKPGWLLADGTIVRRGHDNDGTLRRQTIQTCHVDARGREQRQLFERHFVIGRRSTCDLQLGDAGVSRNHCEVFYADGQWWTRDLGSSNGTFLDGRRIKRAPLPGNCSLRCGRGAAEIHLSVVGETKPDDRRGGMANSASLPPIAQTDDQETLVRKAIRRAAMRQRSRFRWARAALGAVVMVVIIFLLSYYGPGAR